MRVRRRLGFSLLELMIGLSILGLGLIMLATIFPVAWGRTRTLAEFTVEQTLTDNAHVIVQTLTRVSRPRLDDEDNEHGASSFNGDLVVNEFGTRFGACVDGRQPVFSDTRVHALNMENILVAGGDPVTEDLWALEIQTRDEFEAAFFSKQVAFHERLFPPMNPSPSDPSARTPEADLWFDGLASRRFCWAAFHRLRKAVPVPPPNNDLDRSLSTVRTFDMYYVTLRRPRPSARYAQQERRPTPNPCKLTDRAKSAPRARPPKDDVMFPVAWRVQIWFPGEDKTSDFPGIVAWRRDPGTGRLTGEDTGIPTEIMVPPTTMGGSVPDRAMLVQMFPAGARFIDEESGQVYRVINRRITGAFGEQAFLTLDREVVSEDLQIPSSDLRCENCDDDELDPTERLRTVWVFPPAVEPGRAINAPLSFTGSQPVVGIAIRTMNVGPAQ